jgi:hypothetical protein
MVELNKNQKIILSTIGLGLIGRQLFIKNLINKIPLEIRKLPLPHPGNPELLKDREDRVYTSANDEIVKNAEPKKIFNFFEVFDLNYATTTLYHLSLNASITTGVITERIEDLNKIVFKYKNSYFDNLKKNDIITSFQVKIHTGYYQYLGEPSGKRLKNIPEDVNIENIKFYMINVDDDFVFPENFDEIKNKKLVKTGLKWKATDWPFGKPDFNDWGVHIDFDQEFKYTGKSFLFITENYDKSGNYNSLYSTINSKIKNSNTNYNSSGKKINQVATEEFKESADKIFQLVPHIKFEIKRQ